ncbi:transposase [Sphingomonas sanguinis]|nr:transposase [Sphingomonas sanguinis]
MAVSTLWLFLARHGHRRTRPTLKPGDVVTLDNLPARESVVARMAIEAREARLLFLPPYSPDLNPIENAFAKLKALLRKAAARTRDDLNRAIGTAPSVPLPVRCRLIRICSRQHRHRSRRALQRQSGSGRYASPASGLGPVTHFEPFRLPSNIRHPFIELQVRSELGGALRVHLIPRSQLLLLQLQVQSVA